MRDEKSNCSMHASIGGNLVDMTKFRGREYVTQYHPS